MEFERLSESTQWESRKIFAAFGLNESDLVSIEPDLFADEDDTGTERFLLIAQSGSLTIECKVAPERGRYSVLVECEGEEEYSRFYWRPSPGKTECYFHPASIEPLARALYRLEVTDPRVLAELNRPLSAHEKLELRLSLPREFWPKTWIEEDQSSETS